VRPSDGSVQGFEEPAMIRCICFRILLAAPFVLALLAPEPGCFAGTETGDEELSAAIEYLLEYVRTSECVFIRNKREHTPGEAAEHIERKYKHFKKDIETPEDFIRLAASKSTMSGKAYMVRTREGETLTSEAWLLAALAEYRRSQAPGHAADRNRSVAFVVKEFSRSLGGCTEPDTGCVWIEIEYPDITSAPTGAAADSLNAHIRRLILRPVFGDSACSDLDCFVQQMGAEYGRLRGDMPDYRTGWSLERSIKVIYNLRGILSLELHEYSYTGGAHGNYLTMLSSFDAVSGLKVDLDDILVEGFERELNRIGEVGLRDQKDIPDGSSLDSAGFWFENGRFELNAANFAITDRGLAFHFNIYEIAPYAEGPTELLIPFADIHHLIREDGPLGP
jgi:hypothetical protein